MIDNGFFRRLYSVSIGLGILLAAGAFALWSSSAVAGGIASGTAVALVPFASWHLAIRLLQSRAGRILAALLTLGKYGLVGTALYFLLTRGAIHPWAFLAGMLSVMIVFLVLVTARSLSHAPERTA